MRNKNVNLAIAAVLFLLEIQCVAGTIEVRVCGINDQPINPIEEICLLPSDVISLEVVYIADSNFSLIVLGTEIYLGLGHGTLSIANVVWNPAFEPSLRGIQISSNPPKILIWGDACINEIHGQNEPVRLIGNILYHCDIGGTDTVLIRDSQNPPASGSWEVDPEWNPYLPSYGNGFIIQAGMIIGPEHLYSYSTPVNFQDFAIFAKAWLSKTGESNWNPDCDFYPHNDGQVDTLDLSYLIDHWLCPYWDCNCGH